MALTSLSLSPSLLPLAPLLPLPSLSHTSHSCRPPRLTSTSSGWERRTEQEGTELLLSNSSNLCFLHLLCEARTSKESCFEAHRALELRAASREVLLNGGNITTWEVSVYYYY